MDPFPDRDGLAQIFYPHLNYLQLSPVVGNDFWGLTCVGSQLYPSGFFLLSALVSSLGLQGLFFQNPWLIHLVLLSALSLIAGLLPVPRKARLYFVLILFFFPPTQLLLKGYNPHAYNIIFSVLGMVFFYRYLLNRSVVFLILSALAFWFSCTIKHMGVIHFLSFFCARLFVTIGNDKLEWKELFVFTLVLIFTYPFYDFSLLSQYIHQTSLHHGDVTYLIQTSLLLCLGVLVISLVYLYIPELKKHRVIFDYRVLLLHILAICIVSTYSSYLNYSILFMVSAIFGVSLFFYIALKGRLKTVRASFLLTIVSSLTVSCLFYFSHLGEATPIFFFSLYLLLFLLFLRKKSQTFYRITLLVCIIWSNFFPTSIFSHLEWTHISTRGFNITHFNPWSWSKSYMKPMIESVGVELEQYDFKTQERLYIMPNLNVHTSALFQVSINPTKNIGIISLLEIYNEQLKPYLYAFEDENDGMDQLSKSGLIAFIIIDNNQEMFLQGKAEKLRPIDERFSASNGFGGITKQMIFAQFYKKQLLQRDYNLKTYNIGDLSYSLWVHKNYKKGKKDYVNSYLEALRMTTLMKNNRVSQKALDIQRESGKFLHLGRKIESSLLIHEAFVLFSDHAEIELDWTIIKNSLSPFEKRLIRFYGFDLLKKALLEIGHLPFENKVLTKKYKIDLFDAIFEKKSQKNNALVEKIQKLSESNGLLAMKDLLSYMMDYQQDQNALRLYLKLYVQKVSYEERVEESNLAVENYLHFVTKNKEKSIWHLNKAIHIYPKNKRALGFAQDENLPSSVLSLNLAQEDRKFYYE
ncbi:MAG: hypothetical protein KC646_07590 [Candidatus Cloacimonetes bacterium]|nr:hypothetical protein [Candidatus Cloacimonadota bacterium]